MRFLKRKRRDRDWRRHRREFVYLDEVSVTSLVAARDGAISETTTDTLSKTSESESKASIGIPLKGMAFGAESRVRSADSSSREVVRRAVIQSTFRELRTGGNNDIYLARDDKPSYPRRIWDFGKVEEVWEFETLEELRPKIRALTKNGLMLAVDSITRGDILELEVVLDADNMYRLVSALSSIIEIVNGREALFGIDLTDFEQVLPLVEVIDRLLVGLVPICGTSTKFRLVTIDEVDYIIDRKVLKTGSELSNCSRPLEIVGVTEFKSYWRDLRRVLFTDSAYTAYVRVESTGLRADWNPVKLADVLRSIGLDMEQMIRELPNSFAAAVNQPDNLLPDEITITQDSIVRKFEAFGRRIAAEEGVEISDGALHEAAERATIHYTNNADFDGRREAFEIVVKVVEAKGSVLDRELIRRVREETSSHLAAPTLAGSISGDPNNEPSGGSSAENSIAASRNVNKLEVEFVAIYW
jgi:hypothetical protein